MSGGEGSGGEGVVEGREHVLVMLWFHIVVGSLLCCVVVVGL